MDALIKTIKRLNEDEYLALLEKVSTNKFSKPYIVLEAARKNDYNDSQMIDLLQVNPSTYYTLKSRLNSKVATILSKKVDNPISVLLDEVTRVPANLYGTNKEVAIRALKELEKQLLEYDLSNELIIVYKTLARLHMYSPEFESFDKLYNKFVAFSLAASKAENLFYEFIITAGNYELSRSEEDLESMQMHIRELSNISELYDSHRMFVLFNIVRIYYLCIISEEGDALESKEIEIDKTLQEIRNIFSKYPLDTMYNNFRFLVDVLYFQYYQLIGNVVRSRHYYSQVNEQIPELCTQHILSFHVIQFLYSKLGLYIQTGDLKNLTDLNEILIPNIDIDTEEVYQYVSFHRFLAICKFYEGDYSSAARIINNLRNNISLKNYWHTDVDCKLFQALQYTLMGDEDLCLQITNSISRQVRADKDSHKNIKTFIKLLKAAFKTTDASKKGKRINTLWSLFKKQNIGEEAIMSYLKLDAKALDRLAVDYKL